ncbi:MAG TPA: class I SAM-dependent methyltransferase [Candidatus Hydrogenedentes bacterium]|nr:class I SAM-dependent methyltransferase [Candidatus Hydrogenedentota bacterium]
MGKETAALRAHYDALAGSYDGEANQACKRAYAELIRRVLGNAKRVLEIGAGTGKLLSDLDAPFKVATDFSPQMMVARKEECLVHRATANAEQLPFQDSTFDFVLNVNLLEHVSSPPQVVSEAARVLTPGGRFLAITPNGDLAWLLELLERLHLKLPEGPHRFLPFDELAALGGSLFRVEEARRFLACPAGPSGWVRWVDGLSGKGRGWGLFQYLLMEKR